MSSTMIFVLVSLLMVIPCDDFCVGIVANGNTLLFGIVLPHAVDVMDEITEGFRPICWSKGHNGVSPLDCVHTLKGEFLLT
jgi:hypothetical protein